MGDLLVVDDEQHIRAAMTKLLQNVGYEVRSAHSAESALDEIKALQPAVVILDLVMGGMDGFELMEVVRQRAEWRIIDFIICSARVTREQAESINGMQRVTYLPKPFEVQELLRLVAEKFADA